MPQIDLVMSHQKLPNHSLPNAYLTEEYYDELFLLFFVDFLRCLLPIH